MTSRSTDTDRSTDAPAPAFAPYAARLQAEAPGLFRRVLQAGARYADLFGEHTLYTRCRLRRRASPARVAPSTYAERRYAVQGAGLRVLGKAGAGYAATATPDVLSRLPDEAISALQGTGAAARLPELYARPGEAVEADAALREMLERAAEAAFSLDARVVDAEVQYQHQVRQIVVTTSEGRACTCATELAGLRVAVTLNVEGRLIEGHAVEGGGAGPEHFAAYPPEGVTRRAVAQAVARAGARPVPAGQMPVVLAGGWGGVWLHEAVGHLLEADTVAAGGAFGPGLLGRAVAPPGVTLHDDATLPGGRGTAPCDDEGNPAGSALLVEDGVLRGFLTDRRHAAHYGWPQAGAGRRQDYRYPPLPRMTNLILGPGSVSPDALVGQVPEGLYVREVGHGVVFPAEGRYAFEVLDGQRIEQGRLTHPVTGVRIAGDTAASLAGIEAVGTDFSLDTARGLCRKGGQVVPVSVGMPSVLIRALTVEPVASQV